MAYSDFTLQKVQEEFGLDLLEQDLFPAIAPIEPRQEFLTTANDGATVALAINTEKAKSEFIIAPLLLELRKILAHSFGLFSGVELNIDASKGLNSVCDFIISREAKQFTLNAPLITIVEAKNENIRAGLGQCIAEMYAAQIFNRQSKTDIETIYGVVTTGSAWKFLKLEENNVTLDIKEYYIDNLGKIMAIFQSILQPYQASASDKQ